MRVIVRGDGAAATSLRSLIAHDPTLVLSQRVGRVTVCLTERAGLAHPIVDGVDSEIERLIVSQIARAVSCVLIEHGPADTDTITIVTPTMEATSAKVERAVYHALLDYVQQVPPSQRRPRWRQWLAALWASCVVLLLVPGFAAAQGNAVVTVRDSVTGAVAPNVGDSTNKALRVNVVASTGGGGPATVADGADVNAGATTDAALITDTTGTMSAKLRGMVKWAFERMPASLGQKVMTASLPVVIASDQSTLNMACLSGCGGAATFLDNAAFTFGTTAIGNMGAVFDDVAPNAVTENSAAAPRISGNRNLYTQLRDGTGSERGASVTATNALKVDGSAVTQPVSDGAGSLTVDAPVGTPVFVRLSDGAAAVAPALEATLSTLNGKVTAVNTGAVTVSTALPAGAAIIGKVGIDQTTPGTTNGVQVVAALPTGANVIGALTANQSVNVAQVGGAATATAAAGVQKVGIVGNAGAIFDGANNTAMPANALAHGVQTATIDTTPTAATAGNLRYQLGSTEGVAYVQEGGPKRFSCFVASTATVTTQCQAAPAAGLRNYVTSVVVTNAVGTAQSVDLVFGTGAACVTGITALTNKFFFVGATQQGSLNMPVSFPTPLVPTAATAICARPTSASAFGVTITGYVAP